MFLGVFRIEVFQKVVFENQVLKTECPPWLRINLYFIKKENRGHD